MTYKMDSLLPFCGQYLLKNDIYDEPRTVYTTHEGNTEVSKHIANQEHEKGDVTIKAMAYDENWYIDEGTYHLSPIYDNIIV